MNLLSKVQEQFDNLSLKYAAKELETILEKARQQEWTPLQAIEELLKVEQNNRLDTGRLRRLKTANLHYPIKRWMR